MSREGLRTRISARSSPTLVLALALAGSGVFFLLLARGLWFFGDEWSYLLDPRAMSDGVSGVLEPHNEHWSTIPLIVYRLMYSVFGLRHYLAFAVMPVAVHLLICVLLHLRLRRSGVPPWTSVLTVVVLAYLGTGAEDLLWPFQIGFLGSAAGGLAALLALDAKRGHRVRLLGVWTALAVALMCSGMALPMVVWVGCLALLTRGLGMALAATVPPLLLYLVWYVGYGRSAVAQAPDPSAREIGDFLFIALGRIWQTPALPVLGLVILVVLTLVALTARVEPPLHALAVSGIVTALATYLLLAISRAGLGEEAAEAGRYVYFGVLFTLPAFAVLAVTVVGALEARPRWVVALGLVVAMTFVVSGCAEAVVFRDARARLVGGLPARTVASLALVRSGVPLLSDRVEPLYAEPLDVASLRERRVQEALPLINPGPQARWDAQAALLVGVSSARLPVPVATAVTDQRGLVDPTSSGNCVRAGAEADAQLVVHSDAGGVQLRVTPPGNSLVTELTAGGRDSASIVRRVTAHEPVWVGTSVAGADLTVVLQPGDVEFCLETPGQ